MQAPPDPLSQKLAHTRRYKKLLTVLVGVGWVFAGILVIALLCYHVDRVLALSSGARFWWRNLTLFLAVVAGGAWSAWVAYRRIPDTAIAATVEQTFPELKERLLTSIDLMPALASPQGLVTSGFSNVLAKRLIDETQQQVQPLDFRRSISRLPLKRVGIALLVLVGVVGVERVVSAGAFDNWLRRMADPNADIAPWADTRVWVTPDKSLIPVGESITVTVTTRGVPVENATLLYRTEKETEWKRIDLKNPATVSASEKGSALKFQHKFPAMAQTVYLSAKANDGSANEQKVIVEERPTLLGFQMRLRFPAYMKRPDQILPPPSANAKEAFTSDGNILAPVGTQVEVTATANKTLSAVQVLRDKAPSGTWKVDAEKAIGTLDIKKTGTYALHLTDTHGFEGKETTNYEIRALPDQTPNVQISQPTADMDLVPNGSIPLVARATDDYGIVRMGLEYSRVREDNTGAQTKLQTIQKGSLPLPGADGSAAANTSVRWELGSIRPFAGETVQFEVTATDNDTLNGPHVGRSAMYRIHVVSLAEMQRRLKEQMDEEARALQLLRQRQIELQTQLQQARMKSDNPMVGRVQEAQRGLSQETQGVNQRLNELTSRLENNRLATSSEIARRDQASKILENLSTSKMPSAADKIQQAQQNAQNPSARNQAFSQADKEQTANRQEIEKAQSLLQGAPSVEQVANDLERVAKDQQMLADGSRNIAEDMLATRRQTGKKNLTADQKALLDIDRKQQKDLNKDTKSLQENLRRLAQSARERGKNAQADALDRAAKELEQGKATDFQDKALQNLNQNDAGSAASPQDRAASSLKKAADAAKEAMQDQQNRGLKETAESLEKAAERLQELAKQQKEIAKQIGQNPSAEQRAKLAQQEKQIQKEAAQIGAQLSSAPQAQQSAQSAEQSLSQANQELSQNQSQQAQKSANQASQQLQKAAEQAKRAAQRIRQQQVANEMAEKVERILLDQKAILSATQRINQAKQQKKLAPTELRELGQIASRQRTTEQRANDTAADFPSPGFKRALESAAKQMNPASKNLNQDQPNTGAETQDAQKEAVQSLERIVAALKQQGQNNGGNEQNQNSQSGEPSPQMAQQQAALGELMLAQGMQKDVRKDTGRVDTDRNKDPKKQLNPNQQQQVGKIGDTQGDTKEITDSAAQQLSEVPGVGEELGKAMERMTQSKQGLNQKDTGRPTQQHQEAASGHLEQAIKTVQQALEQQRQQQQSANGSQPGMPQPANQPGNNPKRNPFTRLQDVKRGFTREQASNKGKGFSELNLRDQRVLREGQQERVPAEYQELVNRYYRSLAEKKK